MAGIEIDIGTRSRPRRSFSGQWWLPALPEQRAVGTLEYVAGEGGRLELLSTLGTPIELPLSQVVLGVSDEGAPVTICDATGISRSGGFFGDTRKESWRCYSVFIGAHCSEGDATKFRHFSLETSGLSGWVNRPRVRTGDYFGPSPITFEIDRLDSMMVRLDAAAELAISWSDSLHEARLSTHLQVRPSIDFIPRNPLTTDDAWRKFVTPVLFFMTLALGSPDRIVSLLGVPDDDSSEPPRTVEILLPGWAEELTEGSGGPIIHQQLIQFEELLPTRLQTVLCKWFAMAEDSPHSLNDFFRVSLSPPISAEDSFLRVARSIESWHRSRFGGHYLERDTFAEMRENIRGVVSQATWDEYLKERLINAPPFVRRLEDMVEKAGEPVATEIAQYRSFVERTKKTRNSIAHEGRIGTAFKHLELFWAQKALEHVFRSVLLRELGFTEEEVRTAVDRSREWRWMTSPQNRLRYWQEYENGDD